MAAVWNIWNKYEQCDFLTEERYIKSLLKKRNKGNINLHKILMYDCLVLGKYDECRQEFEELHRLENRLKPLQRLEVQLYYIDYLYAVNETEPLHAELENAENLLSSINIKRGQTKQALQRGIKIRRYRIEERWAEQLELLKADRERNQTGWERVVNAYYYGWSCYCLGRYEEAFCELKFAAKYGGNSKYVNMANEMIEQIPEKNLYENKYAGQTKKIKHNGNYKGVVILAVCFLLLIIMIRVDRHYTFGDSIEEAYSKKYFCSQDELVMIYQKEIDNYEMAILYDGEDVVYCLFAVTDDHYRIVETLRTNFDFIRRGDFPEAIGGEEDFFLGNDIVNVLTGFYRTKDIFYQEDAEYVGICFYPLEENIEIDGVPFNIQQLDRVIYINDEPVYLWRLENIDLKNINYRTHISVYRAAEGGRISGAV